MENTPTTEGALRLADALDLKIGTPDFRGIVWAGSTDYYVHLFDQQKKPPLIKWEGINIQYRIGGGRAEMLGDTGVKSYTDESFAERQCDYCHKPYRGPTVYCSFSCAIADAG